jgi:hypothetical protein
MGYSIQGHVIVSIRIFPGIRERNAPRDSFELVFFRASRRLDSGMTMKLF